MAADTKKQSEDVKAPEPTAATPKKARKRSPNYPILNLHDAVERARALYDADTTHWMPIHLGHERLGYKPFSSQSDQTTAALRAYGLIDVEGAGKKRRIKVSEDGERIVRGAPNRDALMRGAALKPAIHRELWRLYGESGLPSDANIKNYLEWDRPEGTFNKDVVGGVIKRFRETIGLVKLESGDIIKEEEDKKGDDKGGGGPSEKPPARKDDVNPLPDTLALLVLEESGATVTVNVPRMTKSAFDFFKGLLDTYKEAIVIKPDVGPQESESSQDAE